LTPRYWRSAPAKAIQAPPISHAGQAQHRGADDVAGQGNRVRQRRGGESAEDDGAFAADDDQAGTRRAARRTRP
jgi:hypothetical protein